MAAAWTPPGPTQRLRALGRRPSRKTQTKSDRLVFAEPEPFYQAKIAPQPGDWLHSTGKDDRRGQTFEQFRRQMGGGPAKPSAREHTVYVAPMGDLPAALLAHLCAYLRAYLSLDVELLPTAIDADAIRRKGRCRSCTEDGVEWDQAHVDPLLRLLLQHRPKGAVYVVGVTMYDLYPDDSWNFCYGVTDVQRRTALCSLARYQQDFPASLAPDALAAAADDAVFLRRSLSVVAHELAHCLGIDHCVYYECLINGANHLAESDAAPLHLCPVDLRKLLLAVQGAPTARTAVARYEALHAWYASVPGFEAEAAWVAGRLELVADGIAHDDNDDDDDEEETGVEDQQRASAAAESSAWRDEDDAKQQRGRQHFTNKANKKHRNHRRQ